MTKLLPYAKPNRTEAGCDEAGRGCLAGPVVAAAVILDADTANELALNDSKKLSEKKRDELRIQIEARAIAWSVSFVSHDKIDEINILQASFLAMRESVDTLLIRPDHILIDGNRFVSSPTMPPHTCIIKGDAKFASIAAASILAKTHRDQFMRKKSIEYPAYQWGSNFGYPTKAHREAIKTSGVSPIHRMTFQLLPK
ncbi:MAG: ribonuclease HII [Flavobacteriales bacterium]|nr:ribonuclease HII [Flavobacteriales bacterium]